MPPDEMDPALRAAIATATAAAEADQPPALHFLHRRTDGGYQPIPTTERVPQPGEQILLDGRVVGEVTGVSQWWTAVPVGGRVKVIVVEVG